MSTKKTDRVPLPTRDFSAEIVSDEIGWTFQLVYDNRISCGMSNFSGTFEGARQSMAEFLRKLADEIEEIQPIEKGATS